MKKTLLTSTIALSLLASSALAKEIPTPGYNHTIPQRIMTVDMGAPGPDAKMGGTCVILPPDYKGELKPT